MANKIKTDARYRVDLARPIKFCGAWLRPNEKHVFDGATVNRLMADPSAKGAINVTEELPAPSGEK
jgi:hypothetical protein